MTPDGRRLAGQGKRCWGLLVDLLIGVVPLFVLTGLSFIALVASSAGGTAAGVGVLAGVLGVYVLALGWTVAIVAIEAELLYRRGRTWGMAVAGLRIVDARTGGPISRGRAWGRTAFARFLSGQVAGFGYWWAFFDDRNRTLHDIVVGTVVVEED